MLDIPLQREKIYLKIKLTIKLSFSGFRHLDSDLEYAHVRRVFLKTWDLNSSALVIKNSPLFPLAGKL